MKGLKLQHCCILLVTLLTGCLGSSNTTTTTATSTRISYAGITDPVSLNTTNSAAILGGAYQGGQSGNAFGSAADLSGGNGQLQRPAFLLLSQALADAIRQADLNNLPGSDTAAALNNVSNQVAGNCGGQMSYTGTEDDSSREFRATFTFTDYCQDATTFTGTAVATGQTDSALGFEHLSLNFDALTIASNGDSFTANGYEIITPAASSFVVKMDMLLEDAATKLVSHIQEFEFTVERGNGYIDLGINPLGNVVKNRYFDPRYGYVELSTPTFLHILDGDYWPSSGILKATGAAGTSTATTGINTSASFTGLNNTTYQLDVDSDGDGTTNSTTTGAWSGL